MGWNSNVIGIVMVCLLVGVALVRIPESLVPSQTPDTLREAVVPKQVHAVYQYSPTGGDLVVGNEVTPSLTNISTWRGAVGNDGRYWSVTRTASGMDRQLFFDGVEQYGANKIIITLESKNVGTGDTFVYQICDWVSATDVDNAASGNCSDGGWRTLNKRRASLTSVADTTSVFEIYNGYFWATSTTPGTVISTPIANFIKDDSTKRVLIRTYSLVNSAVQHDLDEARIEVAIDPVYEPSNFSNTGSFTGTTTEFVSSVLGVTANDDVKFVINNNTTNPIDTYFSFTNVETYEGANTIVVKPEICVSNAALTFNISIWNFITGGGQWEQLNTATVIGTACNTDTAYAFAKNNVDLGNYVSGGEVRIRFNTTTSNSHNIRIDRLYLMVGSTNTDSSLCEISMGTGTATDCANTRDVADLELGTIASTSVWGITPAAEYPGTRWALDDDNATDGERGRAANISFPVTVSPGMAVTAIHWATRFKSGTTTETLALGAKDYGGVNTTGGWSGTIGGTNAATTYSWTDSWQSAELQVNPEDYLDTVNNLANLRVRTSASTDTIGGVVGNWDFAMVSIRWVTNTPVPQAISFSVSDNSIGFGNLTPAMASYATGDLVGATAPTVAHTLTASTTAESGYVISVDGTTLASGTQHIDAIGSTNTASAPGSAQFGLRLTSSGGTGTVLAPYAASGYAFDTASMPDLVAQDTDGDGDTTTYSIYYLANIAEDTVPGSYGCTVSYMITGTF